MDSARKCDVDENAETGEFLPATREDVSDEKLAPEHLRLLQGFVEDIARMQSTVVGKLEELSERVHELQRHQNEGFAEVHRRLDEHSARIIK